MIKSASRSFPEAYPYHNGKSEPFLDGFKKQMPGVCELMFGLNPSVNVDKFRLRFKFKFLNSSEEEIIKKIGRRGISD